MSTNMNSFIVALIISVAISFFAWATKSRKEVEESGFSYAIKIAVISFVCVYFGMMYFISPACPDIIQGEPDF